MTNDPLIDEALQVVGADPDGHLPLALRRRIRRRFGPVLGVANGGPTDGLRAVVRLDRLAAERVQRHWEAGTGGDGGFRRVLDLAGRGPGRDGPAGAGRARGGPLRAGGR